MERTILIVSRGADAEQCIGALAQELRMATRLVTSRRAALAAVRREEFHLLLVDEPMVEADPAWADLLWQNAGVALPMIANLSRTRGARLLREVRSALWRREQEVASMRRAAAVTLHNELRTSVTGLLLQSELALREPTVSAELAPRLRHLVELAGTLQARLQARV